MLAQAIGGTDRLAPRLDATSREEGTAYLAPMIPDGRCVIIFGVRPDSPRHDDGHVV